MKMGLRAANSSLHMFSGFFLVLFMGLAPATLHSDLTKQMDIKSTWSRTHLEVEDVLEVINNQNCYSNKDVFLACVLGIQQVVSLLPGGQRLLVGRSLENMSSEVKGLRPYLGERVYLEKGKNISSELLEMETYINGLPNALDEWTQANIEKAKGLHALVSNFIQKEVKKSRENWERFFLEEKKNTGQSLDFAGLFIQGLEILQKKKIVTQHNKAFTLARVLNSYLTLLQDHHSVLLPKEFLDNHLQSSPDNQVGLGLSLALDKKLQGAFVSQVTEGSPAAKAGIKYRDIIVSAQNWDGAVAGPKYEFAEVAMEEIGRRLQGPENTSVALEIIRHGRKLKRPVIVTRTKILWPNIKVKSINIEGHRFHHIALSSFTKNSCREMQIIVESISSKSSGMILDLRDNGGGDLEEAICMAGLFLGPKKKVVGIKYKVTVEGGQVSSIPLEEQQINFRMTKDFPAAELPLLVVLQNAKSASAAEILTSSLQDSYWKSGHPALIVGERSYGKGSVQGIYQMVQDLPYLQKNHKDVYFKMTVAHLYRINMKELNLLGVAPDVFLERFPGFGNDFWFSPRESDRFVELGRERPLERAQGRSGPYFEWVKTCTDLKRMETQSQFAQILSQRPIFRPDYQLMQSLNVLSCMSESKVLAAR